MKILALESTAKAASAAICEDGKYIGQYYLACGLTHSRTLVAMAENILKDMELTVADIDAIAVAIGPGSFTGVRIGVAAAKGLAWGGDLQIIPVSTLEAMANQCYDENVIICPVMDARRSQVYNAKFVRENGEIIRLCDDRAISVEGLIEEAKASEKPFFLIGDGAEMCFKRFTDADVSDVILAPENIRLQLAYGVAKAAVGKQPIPGNEVEPNYLRMSQAERERLEKNS